MSKVTCRDFIFFSDQAAPQWEKAIAKLLVVLEFLPWALRGILLFGARDRQAGCRDLMAAGRSWG